MFMLKNKANSKAENKATKEQKLSTKEKQQVNKIENLKIIIFNPTTKIDHNFATLILLSILSFYLHHLHPTILHLTPLGIRHSVNTTCFFFLQKEASQSITDATNINKKSFKHCEISDDDALRRITSLSTDHHHDPAKYCFLYWLPRVAFLKELQRYSHNT